MSFQYAVIEENGELFDELTDLINPLRIRVRRLGAEMVSMARRDASGKWHGFLYRDGETAPPASGWANHATVMGYFTHRIFEEKSNYRGHILHGGTHGFVRHFSFDAPGNHPSEDGRLVYRVPADRIPKDAYPYKVSLELSYKLDGEWIEVEFKFESQEMDVDTHVSFGLHPGFAVSSIDGFHFRMPPGIYKLLESSGNFLNGKVRDIPHEGGDMPFARETLVNSYLLDLREIKDRHFVFEDPGLGRKVELDYGSVPYLTLWSDGNPFLCAEPTWGVPDSDPPVPFDQKQGIQMISPGGVLKKSFRFRPGF